MIPAFLGLMMTFSGVFRLPTAERVYETCFGITSTTSTGLSSKREFLVFKGTSTLPDSFELHPPNNRRTKTRSITQYFPGVIVYLFILQEPNASLSNQFEIFS
jgi:hypothetical protein